MQQKCIVLRLFFMAEHLFIKPVAKLYFAVAKGFLFALVPINGSWLSFKIYFFRP